MNVDGYMADVAIRIAIIARSFSPTERLRVALTSVGSSVSTHRLDQALPPPLDDYDLRVVVFDTPEDVSYLAGWPDDWLVSPLLLIPAFSAGNLLLPRS